MHKYAVAVGVVSAIVGVTALAASRRQQPAAPQVRTVTLTIATKKPDGTPLSGMPFGLQPHMGKDNAALVWSAISDSSGIAKASVQVDTRATSLVIGPRAVSLFPDAPGVDPTAEFRKRMKSFKVAYAMPSELRVRLSAGAASVYASYQVVPGATVTGRLIRGDTNAPILAAIIGTEGYLADADADLETGVFTMAGVPRLASVWIAAGWGSRTVYREISVTGASLALGDWAIPNSDVSCPVTVTVPIPAGKPESKAASAVSFVRADGRDVFSFFTRRTGLEEARSNPDGLIASSCQSPDMVPRIAPGTYYVFPDLWMDTEAQSAFIRRLRAGELPPAGVAKFVATGSQAVSGTIDTLAAQGAIVAWLRPYVESNGQSGEPPSP